MSKRIAIVGRGTAGSISAALAVSRYLRFGEIVWYYDPSIQTQAVGEGSTLRVPGALNQAVGFMHSDLEKLDGTFKSGIRKIDWSRDGQSDFIHPFLPPQVSYHFNALKLQDFLYNRIKSRVRCVEGSVSSEKIDADYIIDCSGKPSDYTSFEMSSYIPVNSVYVTQCFWDRAEFQYTMTIARPYGWVFGIPLMNRCSIGYMYNNTINTLDEVKEDVKHVFKQLNLTPSNTTNSFSFKNYRRIHNFKNNIAYNGNASFFLEPLEATSITVMIDIMDIVNDIVKRSRPLHSANTIYSSRLEDVERLIMLHYLNGSAFDTQFWNFAQRRAEQCILQAKNDPDYMIKILSSEYTSFGTNGQELLKKNGYSKNPDFSQEWPLNSYRLNLGPHGFNIYDKIKNLWGVKTIADIQNLR